jgi:AraC-like DNA-binding protein
MKYHKPKNVLSGFHAQTPDPDVPELTHVGEQWVPADFLIPVHSHPVWEFYFQIDGLSVWSAAPDHTFRCSSGGFFAPIPGLNHSLVNTFLTSHHFVFAGIDVAQVIQHRLPQLALLWQRKDSIYLPNAASTENAFRHLIREVSLKRPYRTEGLRIAIDALVIEVSRLLEIEHRQEFGTSFLSLHPAVEQTRQILDQNYAQSWNLNDLGRLANISPNHLVRLFTDEIGSSPHQYLIRLRIERAKDLLSTSDVSITQVAFELGFSSSQHFASTFKRNVGMTAGAFRRQINPLDTKPSNPFTRQASQPILETKPLV